VRFIGELIIDVLEKLDIGIRLALIAPPHPDEAEMFPNRIGLDLEIFGHGYRCTARRDDRAFPGRIIPETMEWTFHLLPGELAAAQRRAAMRALVSQARERAVSITPDDQPLAEALDAEELVFLDLFRIQDGIPLIPYHEEW